MLHTALAFAAAPKLGISGDATCGGGLQEAWHHNWGLLPDGNTPPCATPRAAEFVPMFRTCGANCTSSLPDNYRELWQAAGVRCLLGFNEPDNKDQANLTPAAAAQKWPQLQAVAASFSPPLELVAPGITHRAESACELRL